MKRAIVFLFFAVSVVAANAANTLRVVSAGPVGEVASLAEANEVRVVFSEPMVVVGKIPTVVAAPFFHIKPEAKGTFRWSGTTTLIFTPDPPLPFATNFDVTVDQTTPSAAGDALDRPYQWSFITPPIKLLTTNWYRKPNRAVVIALMFNRPVEAGAILQHLQLRTVAHELKAPSIPAEDVERLKAKEPREPQAFDDKKAKAARIATSNGVPVLVFAATEWDHSKLGVETKPGIDPETHIQLILDDKLATRSSRGGKGRQQSFTIELEPMLFVDGLTCDRDCNPDRYNAIRFRARELSIEQVRKAVSVTDITDPAREVVLKPKVEDHDFDYADSEYNLDSIGYTLLPARRYLSVQKGKAPHCVIARTTVQRRVPLRRGTTGVLGL